MPVSPDSPTDGADRRQRLVDTARRLFAERSYEQVTTTEIAKAAGVAYGLIAHHFNNKHGLYLSVMREIAQEITANQEKQPRGETLSEQLRTALTDHISYIDQHADGFLAIMRGGLGADPDLRALVDDLRWAGAARILHGLGITDPRPTLRAAMRGWVGYLDELMIDRIQHRDLSISTLVELAAANLTTTLRTATALDPHADIDDSILDAIDQAPTPER